MNYDLLKGKLCWFWNKENDLHIDIFCDYYQDKEFPEQNTFYSLNGSYKYCKPAKVQDVMFYQADTYLSAKEKAEQGIIDAIDEYFKDVLPDYKDDLPNYVEGMRKNKEHIACGESDGVVKAIEKYMELL